MRSRTLRRWTAALATAALAGTGLVGPATEASADVPGYEVVRQTSGATNSYPTRSTTAECTGDNELIGMGASVFPTQTEVLLESVVPDLNDDTVEVFARESATGTGNSWRVQAYAVCADPGQVQGRYLATDDHTISSSGLEANSAIADCDPGDRTLSAGFVLSGAAGRIHLTTLMPTTDSALVVGQEDQTTTNALWTVEAIALCADMFDSEVSWDESFAVSTSNGRTHWSPCPEDYRVSGSGGFAQDETGATGTQNIHAFEPSAFDGLDYGVVSSNEPRPGTPDQSTLYGYVVCIDLN